jgi:hypothetical protein
MSVLQCRHNLLPVRRPLARFPWLRHSPLTLLRQVLWSRIPVSNLKVRPITLISNRRVGSLRLEAAAGLFAIPSSLAVVRAHARVVLIHSDVFWYAVRITRAGGGFNVPYVPEGNNVCFLQVGTLQQLVTFPSNQTRTNGGNTNGTFIVQFQVAMRLSGTGQMSVLIDGNVITTFQYTNTAFKTVQTVPFSVSPGTHWVGFSTPDTSAGFANSFIDLIRIFGGT